MKRRNLLQIGLFVMISGLAVGCGAANDGKDTGVKSTRTAEAVLKEDMDASPYDEIDIDLTQMSSTMVYAEVTNMILKPERYEGKIVKMKGPVILYKGKEADGSEKYDFAVLIEDATACCQQGMEFELSDTPKDPQHYPELDERVCVVGRFEKYETEKFSYCHVADAQLVS